MAANKSRAIKNTSGKIERTMPISFILTFLSSSSNGIIRVIAPETKKFKKVVALIRLNKSTYTEQKTFDGCAQNNSPFATKITLPPTEISMSLIFFPALRYSIEGRWISNPCSTLISMLEDPKYLCLTK